MNEYLKSIKDSLTKNEKQIKEIEEAINIMSEAGEIVTSLQSQLESLKTRRTKWIKALENHGV